MHILCVIDTPIRCVSRDHACGHNQVKDTLLKCVYKRKGITVYNSFVENEGFNEKVNIPG